MSPQSHFLEQKRLGNVKASLSMNWKGTNLTLDEGITVTIPYDNFTRLPKLRAYTNALATAESLAYACVSDERNQNLSHKAKTLLQWHFRLGHVGFQRLKWIGRQGWLGGVGERFGLSSVEAPKCAACQFGQQQRLKKEGKTTSVDTDREGILKKDKLEPGDLIFSDQYQSSLPGRVFGRRGAAIHSKTYTGGTIFCDAASKRLFLRHQSTLTAQETVEAKLAFEREALQVGVSVKAYQTDNGIYTSKEFLDCLVEDNQVIKHSGVGGHHHNGAAESAIKHTTNKSRTMMIHQALRWPEESDKTLWPLALEHAVYLHNNTPDPASGLTPEEIWSRSISSHSPLRHAHVWGCVAYVLDHRLADGQKIPKWQPRSRRAMYVGRSPLHASSVGVVLNLQTGNLSPQFHVVYDDFFETVHSTEADEPTEWPNLVLTSTERAVTDEDDGDPRNRVPPLAKEWDPGVDPGPNLSHQNERRGRIEPPVSQRETTNNINDDGILPPQIQQATMALQREPPSALQRELPSAGQREQAPVLQREPQADTRVSTRQRFLPDIFSPGKGGMEKPMPIINILASLVSLASKPKQDYSLVYALLMDPEFGIMDNIFPHAYSMVPHLMKASRQHDPDTPNLHQALSGDHRDDFLEAMSEEISQLEAHGTWTIVRRSSVPEGANIISSTWAFKVKRFPDGKYRKTKARFCCRGDMQVANVDYFHSWSPVVPWSTVRLVLSLALSQGWESRQIDFSNAFVQSHIKEDVYIRMPPMFESPRFRLI